MLALIQLLVVLFSNRFKSRQRLEIENLYLRHQLNIALRRSPHRLRLRMADRALFAWFGRRRSCAGIEQVFAASLAVNRGVPRLVTNCAGSSGG
jgi:hypothetical protein